MRPFIAVGLLLAATEAHAQNLTAAQVERMFWGGTARHHHSGGYTDYGYSVDGEFSQIGGPYRRGGGVAGGELGLMGTYRIEPDGRLCYRVAATGPGCFRYYRKDGKLHVRRDDAESRRYIGTVTLK